MKRATAIYLKKNDEVLMAIKQQFVGVGKWFGYGGKIEDGEKPEESACREIFEESGGVKVKPEDLSPVALIDFYRGDTKSDNPLFRVLFYTTELFSGTPRDTGEMKNPTWFPINNLPTEEMKKGDELIIPRVLSGKPHKGFIWFSEDEKTVLDFKIEPCDTKDLVV